MPDQYLDNDAEQPMINLSNISLEKMEFMKEISAMDEEEFHAKIGVFNAVTAIPTKKEQTAMTKISMRSDWCETEPCKCKAGSK
ncbi:hypothetical protein C8R26_1124 [Nitrosomonas oligotropha]|uniref:Uncharacterized protein n=1 Tax=Nitrosomonas oligotropha TaxID=42354 RepID=A0A2T5HZ55_9PROT|nr:hypothetical protein [Nitrosomonas oligotropha]PTQ76853.1 hypothetical protein C8R26_1124 [Nitrosomonas oligotropha]